MKQPNWTIEQKNAIEAGGNSLAVTAAAGSGKTAVLVQRVMRLLTDEKNPVLADRLVIVTFTEAAAAEMKSRLLKQMEILIEDNPDNTFYQNQNFLLSRANISTIHSFCLGLITENFQKLGLKSGFTIADDNTISAYIAKASEEIFEEYYTECPEKISKLADFFDSNGDRGLEKAIFQLDYFLNSLPYPGKWLKNQKNIYSLSDNEFKEVYFKELMPHIESDFNLQKIRFRRFEYLIKSSGEKCESDNSEILSSISTAIEKTDNIISSKDWTALGEYAFECSKRWNGKNCKYNDECKKLKSDIIKGLNQIYISAKELYEGYSEDKKTVSEILELLFEFYKAYSRRLKEIKTENNVITFSDILHLTIKLLTEEKSGEMLKNNFARDLSHQYDYIIVDEFQDVNDVQDTIFKLVSQDEKNLFIVGDTKQSIYRFQQANPDIFISKTENTKNYDEKDNASLWQKIKLSKNFRSRKEVTDFVNFVFSKVMKKQVGEIDYKGEELVYGADYKEAQNMKPEIYFIDEKMCKESGYESENTTSLEAEFVARKIREMLDERLEIEDKGVKRPCCEGDFCILLRSPSERIYTYLEKLNKYGIKASNSDGKGFYETREISSVMNFLKVINNPLRDINVAALVMSPIFMMSAKELAQIKANNPDVSLFMAIKKSNTEKSVKFINMFDKLRRYASGYSLEKLVLKLYDETKILSIVKVMTNSEGREANLHLLVERIKSYEQNSPGGLSGFLRWTDIIKEKGKDKASSVDFDCGDSVRIMSIHKSKGLEFPICFVCGLGTDINLMDYSSQMILDVNGGIGFCIRNNEEFEYYPSLPYKYLKLKGITDTKGEEIRLFYVALTRAKQKLVLTAKYKNISKNINDISYTVHENNIVDSAVANAKCVADWLLMSLMCNENTENILMNYAAYNHSKSTAETDLFNLNIVKYVSEQCSEKEKEKTDFVEPDENVYQAISNNINFIYDYDELTKLPAKTTVTEIIHEQSGLVKITKIPSFISKTAKSGTDVGNAYHKFLQYADFSENAENEINRLLSDGLLNEQEVCNLNSEKLNRILQSSFFERIKKAKKLWREYKFMSAITAKEYKSNIPDKFADVSITVQGMADCVFEEDDKLVLVDYKTDKVSSENDLIKKYAGQLELYTNPIENNLKMKIKERIIYSVYLEKEILL